MNSNATVRKKTTAQEIQTDQTFYIDKLVYEMLQDTINHHVLL